MARGGSEAGDRDALRESRWNVRVQFRTSYLHFRHYSRFRWVFCQLETLRHCFPPSLRHVLQELPKSLDETYDCILKNINQATRAYARRLLQCLMVAARPLRLEELAEVLAFNFDEAPGGIPTLNADWRREDQERAVLSTCSSLITIVHDGDSRVVQFSHFSVKEFLTSDRLAVAAEAISFYHIAPTPSHTILAQACLGILLRPDNTTWDNIIQRFPLTQYASQHWVGHALFKNVSSRIKDGIERLFDNGQPQFSRWVRNCNMDDATYAPGDYSLHEASPMYYAAFCGFSDMIQKLIKEHPEHVTAMGGPLGMPLHAASRRNHLKIVQSLLRHGADVNATGMWGRTPLLFALSEGYLEVVRSLLEHGADVDAKNLFNWTSLHMAAYYGHFETAWILLKHNADVNARENNEGRTPLHLASNLGHIDTAQLLLNHGADPNARDRHAATSLHTALSSENFDIGRLLLEHGAEVDADAYQIASDKGNDGFFNLLLAYEAERMARISSSPC